MPGFDIAGARKAGYSDDQIKQFLSKSIDVDGAMKAGYSLDQIANYLNQKPAAPTPTYTDKLVQNLGNPFEQLAGRVAPNNPLASGVGQTLDLPMSMAQQIARGFQQMVQSRSPIQTAQGATTAAVGAAALPFSPAISAFNAATKVVPGLGRVASTVASPFTSITNPQTEQGRALAGTADNLLQLGMLAKAPDAANDLKSVPSAIRENMNTSRIAKAQTEIKKVAPPTPKEIGYDAALNRATPYIAAQLKETPINPKSDVSAIRQATDIVSQAKSNLWDNQISPQIEKHAGQTVDGSEISNAVRASISDYTRNHDPRTFNQLKDYADSFAGNNIPIEIASQYISELNARTSAYQKSTPIQRAQMEAASPNIAAESAAVNALRDAVYNKLDELGDPAARKLRGDYGALAQVHKALERNIVKAERQTGSASFYTKPFETAVATAATIEGLAHAPATTAVAAGMGFIKRNILARNKPNPTINRAFNRLGKVPDVTQIAPPLKP